MHLLDSPDVWMPIPGFSRYEINEVGVVRNWNKQIISQSKWGDYLKVVIAADDGEQRMIMVHVALCLAFHGKRPDLGPNVLVVTVNHKDGNKENNTKSNVEWVSNSDNVLHAYKTRLNKTSQHVLIDDELTGERFSVHSYEELMRWVGSPHLKGRIFCSIYRDKLYQDRYRITELPGYEPGSGAAAAIQIKVFDIAAKHNLRKSAYDGYVFGSVDEASGMLSLSVSRIKTILRLGNLILFNGYLFMKANDMRTIPGFTKEQVEKSLRIFKAKQRRKNIY
ncbi:putative HNH endonuclease [Erwinia phage vB_EamM_Desertfox]|uniref:Putative HNH endonuclease n=4 Tax=Agricanvirus TaxID=1984776 RepID=A0A482IHY2_9CAUD|nr:putative HNH endonuclease [Erwinia phage vB_EamM_Deimos-Minion]YP_009621829.1 putative HNH endonuclease [Erwinia phage vB_EamM_Desertfox]AUG86518.1 putative HNH endonuclease [Erwinia phage vB_EamM_MadMel]QBP07197.1 putative HNH endonuclease [Erwinia phage Rebecca]ANH52191.1 putative HNH endonuclease [Erwinia phage vB_EamM_Deimos-Minion]AUG86195.1 putative HNH endonuclease [Erwinia phage vB_EamM_Desertfox]